MLVCNYAEATGVVAAGAKAYVILQLGGNLPERVRVLAHSRGGRWVEKWENLRRLTNFRLVTIPPGHPRYDDRRLFGEATEGHLDEVLRAAAEVGGPAARRG